MDAIEVSFQGIDVGRPEAAEWRQPLLDLLKRLRLQSIESALRIDGGFDESSFAEHPQMFGDRWLRHAQPSLDLADRLLRRDEQAEYGPPVRLRDNPKDRFHIANIRSTAYARQGIYSGPCRPPIDGVASTPAPTREP